MVNERFGKIKRESPMFDIVFQTNDTIVQEVRSFYEKISFYPFSEKTTFFSPEPVAASKSIPDWYKNSQEQ